MKNVILALIFFSFFTNEIKSQAVVGKLVDENGTGLSSIFLQLYISPDVHNTTSLSDGSFVFYNITNVEDEQLPTGYVVSNNFPNPFNRGTNIPYQLTAEGHINLSIYDLTGKEVRSLVNNMQLAGNYQIWWDGTDNNAHAVASGIYIVVLKIDNSLTLSRQMVLLK